MAPTNDTRPKKAFPFFRLPRELRDNIYDLLPAGRRLIRDSRVGYSVFRVWLGDRPLQRFMLVNKAFNDEYSERAQKKKNIRIQDTRNSSTNIATFQLPASAATAPSVTFDLACLIDERDLPNHIIVIKDILSQMTSPPAINIRLYFEVTSLSNTEVPNEDSQSMIQDLNKLDGLALLEIWTYEKDEPKREEIEAGRLVVSYTYDGA